MHRISAYWKDKTIVRLFRCVYDAIDFKDIMDANYPDKVKFEKGVFSMREWTCDMWNVIMDSKHNPLRNIPDLQVRHLVMQVLAWMWCITFSMYFSSMWMFGITAIAHAILIAAIVVTVSTFTTASLNPIFFIKKGYHTPSRTRALYYNGKRIELDANDPGGEHD